MLKMEEIKSIVKLMSENDITEFKVESEDMTLCLRRGSQPSANIQTIVPAVAPVPVTAAAPAAPAAPAPAPASPAAAPEVPDKAKIIESPVVGTFYRSSTPGGDALVKVGSKVDQDTTVCIVEAMKVMNEIKADKAGIIKEILVENGQPVEYGQPLFLLE